MFRAIPLLVVATFLLSHPVPNPISLADGTSGSCEPAVPADDCCERAPTTPSGEKPVEEDCCPNGCQGCVLTCCGGSAALAGALVTGQIGLEAASLLPPTSTTRLPGSNQHEIDHPPRI